MLPYALLCQRAPGVPPFGVCFKAPRGTPANRCNTSVEPIERRPRGSTGCFGELKLAPPDGLRGRLQRCRTRRGGVALSDGFATRRSLRRGSTSRRHFPRISGLRRTAERARIACVLRSWVTPEGESRSTRTRRRRAAPPCQPTTATPVRAAPEALPRALSLRLDPAAAPGPLHALGLDPRAVRAACPSRTRAP